MLVFVRRSHIFVFAVYPEIPAKSRLVKSKTILHVTEENPLCKMHIHAFINLFTH